uniref:Peptidase A1 domain-containing protein n=1 Tax=Angiostrongylus cantonensis TaxID=6313 RepID=A0A0K0DQU8_ANGCA
MVLNSSVLPLINKLPVCFITEQVLDYGNNVYVANVTIGTPHQQFGVMLDTGSAMFWLPGNACDASCAKRHTFETNASSTIVGSNKTWKRKYGIGEATFGGSNEQQLAVPNTTFGLAKHISGFKHVSAIGMGNYTHAEVYEAASDRDATLIGGPRIVTDQIAKMAGAVV